MLPALLEQGHYQVAHELQKTYGKNFKQAIKCLVKGHLYFQAIVEVSVNSEEVALLEQYVKPKLLAYVKQLQEQLSDDETDFIAHKKRLHDVRLFAQLKRTGFLNNDEVVDIDEADLLSDTTSMRSSRYTGSSQGTGWVFDWNINTFLVFNFIFMQLIIVWSCHAQHDWVFVSYIKIL